MIEKYAIITGANRGIGLAICKKFLSSGYSIIFCSRKKDYYLKKLFDQNIIDSQFKNQIHDVYFDLEDNDSINSIYDFLKKKNLNIEVLVNNAGSIDTKLFLMSKIEDIKSFFEKNLFSTLNFTQKISKLFIKKKKGNIVNISSTAGIDGVEGRITYSMVKSSVNMMTNILAKELSYYNIRVNCVAPGLTETDLMRESHNQEIINATINKQSLKKIAKTSEVANLVYYLSSEESSHITGQVFRIDGGISI